MSALSSLVRAKQKANFTSALSKRCRQPKYRQFRRLIKCRIRSSLPRCVAILASVLRAANQSIVPRSPRQRGRRLGIRLLKPESERLLGEVIDVWAARTDRLPRMGSRWFPSASISKDWHGGAEPADHCKTDRRRDGIVTGW